MRDIIVSHCFAMACSRCWNITIPVVLHYSCSIVLGEGLMIRVFDEGLEGRQ